MILKAHLKINGKLFCKCSSEVVVEGNPVSQNNCEICRGLPGALPVLNKEAVEAAMKFASAAKCKISRQISFCRKIDKKRVIRYSTPLAFDGAFKDVGIQVKEVRVEESSGGEAILSISTNDKCRSETIESVLRYLGLFGGTISHANDKYADTLLPSMQIEKTVFEMPEFSWKKISRWTKLGIDENIASKLASDPMIAEAFDANPSPDYARFFTVHLSNALERNSVTFAESNISKQLLRSIFARMRSGEVTEREAEEIISESLLRPREGEIVLNRKVYKRIGDEHAIKEAINKVISENPSMIVDWRIGRQNLSKVMGKVMEKFEGRADPTTVRKLLEQRLVLKEHGV